jgi:hypothetical protein
VNGYTADTSEWTQFFTQARSRVLDLTPVHLKIGDYMLPHVRNNFETEGGATFWARLAPSTRTQERLRYGLKPLLKTRELLRSMNYRAERAFLDLGTPLMKARALFYGNPARNLPARSPWNFLSGVLEPIGDMYAAFVLGVH